MIYVPDAAAEALLILGWVLGWWIERGLLRPIRVL